MTSGHDIQIESAHLIHSATKTVSTEIKEGQGFVIEDGKLVVQVDEHFSLRFTLMGVNLIRKE